ncbi:transmembrane protein 107-like isoform X2 [Crassostrea angulata]|uniref:transmembrane protein 107-like isoform X2 n=1 Tax=Magallana angulata TaxID=2784310 RepID=UPI0022B1AAF3|nr:transmembrane protein 107-like isoform X2 [Crassostrea angulata]
MRISGIVPARFLTIVAHVIILIILFWAKDDNIKQCLPSTYTQSEYDSKDTEMIIGLSVGLGLMLIELIGFIGGISMFMPFQSMLSVACHAGAVIALFFFLFEFWPCSYYWYIFGFCSAFPAVTEMMVWLGVGFFHKGL